MKDMTENQVQELLAEATQAFYKWESAFPSTGLSDEDRIIWCMGYVFCIESERNTK